MRTADGHQVDLAQAGVGVHDLVGRVQAVDDQAPRGRLDHRLAQVDGLRRVAGNVKKRHRAVGRQACAQRLQPIAGRPAPRDILGQRRKLICARSANQRQAFPTCLPTT